MRAEVIGVGTEILLGQICNTNAQWISQELATIGVDVPNHQVVGDNEQRIAEAFRLAIGRAEVVIATGGLGPTQDDITREGLTAALGAALVRDHSIERFLRERFAGFGRAMPESNLKQCDVPQGARVILPMRGTAPGLMCLLPDSRRAYLVPGVPSEMREMMTGTILPELARLIGPSTVASQVLKVMGVAEATVGETLDDLFRGSTNPTVAYLAGGGEVKVRLTAKAATRQQADRLLRPVATEIERRLGDHVYSSHDEELERVVGRLLATRRHTVASAESLTGGGLAERLTSVPGASAYFRGSAVCYTAESKMSILGVRPDTIAAHGMVSEQCAREMAAGARRIFGADFGVAATGVAGPQRHDGKPVGTVCVALAGRDGDLSRTFRAPGDRQQIRRWAQQVALDMLRRRLEGLLEPSDPGPATTSSA